MTYALRIKFPGDWSQPKDWSLSIVPPALQYGGLLLKRSFSWPDKKFRANYGRGVLHGLGGQGGMESFTNAFSSNLNTLNLKVLPNHGRKYTWRESLDQSTELWKERGKWIIAWLKGLPRGRGVGGNSVWCLVIWDLDERRWGEVLK